MCSASSSAVTAGPKRWFRNLVKVICSIKTSYELRAASYEQSNAGAQLRTCQSLIRRPQSGPESSNPDRNPRPRVHPVCSKLVARNSCPEARGSLPECCPCLDSRLDHHGCNG